MKIVVATPVYGPPDLARVTFGYFNAMLELVQRRGIGRIAPLLADTDVVRARSILLHRALATDADAVLWWDEDVYVHAATVGKTIDSMIATGCDFVTCAYPRKSYRYDDRGNAGVSYPIEPIGEIDEERLVVEVQECGLGFALCRRGMLETISEHYRSSTGFVGPDGETLSAPFLLMREGGRLLSEDFSFCNRWRKIGGKIHAYVGPGAKLGHLGSHLYFERAPTLTLESYGER